MLKTDLKGTRLENDQLYRINGSMRRCIFHEGVTLLYLLLPASVYKRYQYSNPQAIMSPCSDYTFVGRADLVLATRVSTFKNSSLCIYLTSFFQTHHAPGQVTDHGLSHLLPLARPLFINLGFCRTAGLQIISSHFHISVQFQVPALLMGKYQKQHDLSFMTSGNRCETVNEIP